MAQPRKQTPSVRIPVLGVLCAAILLIPFIEIALFIQVGRAIGVWATLGLVLLIALLGTTIIRMQGLSAIGRARANMDRGIAPLREVFDGVCLIVAGGLFVLPGFFSDALATLLVVPFVRTALYGLLQRRLEQAPGRARPSDAGAESRRPAVIDVDYEEIPPDDPEPPRRPGQGWDRP